MLDHLIVDGYNVLHAWAATRPTAPARAALLRDLERAAAERGLHCTVVFDGTPIEDVTHASSAHLTVLFSGPRATADSVIERLACQQQERCGVVVVTDDHVQGNLVVGWGAHCWSARMLAQWLAERS